MELSVAPTRKIGLEAKPSVESDKTTFDTPSHTFISRKSQKASPKGLAEPTAGAFSICYLGLGSPYLLIAGAFDIGRHVHKRP